MIHRRRNRWTLNGSYATYVSSYGSADRNPFLFMAADSASFHFISWKWAEANVTQTATDEPTAKRGKPAVTQRKKFRNSERERERERSPFHWIIHTHKYINRYIQQIVMKTSWDREIVALFFSYFSWNPIENQKKPRRPLLLLLLLLCRLVWQHC